jgi:hypothetical protein
MLIRLSIEESDNELDESQESTIKNLLISATDGTDAVFNYVGSSTNQELQAILRTPKTREGDPNSRTVAEVCSDKT